MICFHFPIFVANGKENSYIIDCERTALLVLFILLYKLHGQKQKQETRGTGITSRIVLAADREGSYSHVGILKKENGKWHVIHAVPGEPDFKGDADRVKMETIEHFFEAGKAIRGAVMRVSKDSTVACKAAKNALNLFLKRVPFDHSYNLNDTTEMYCTELIDYVYRKEGVDLPEGRISSINIPGLRGDYLLPNDIVQSKRLCLIYYF